MFESLAKLFNEQPFDFDKTEDMINNLILIQKENTLTFLVNYLNYENIDDEVKTFIYNLLSNIEYDYPNRLIIRGLKDSDSLIRLSTLDIIDVNSKYEFLPEIIKALNDQDSLVRNYAAETMGSIILYLRDALLEKENIETNLVAKVGIYQALYFCRLDSDKEKSIDYLLENINNNNIDEYLSRIRSINSLAFIGMIDSNKKDFIQSELLKIQNQELPISVQEAIINGLDLLND